VGGLGPLLCWAVVFADIGTSVYYTPGILFSRVGVHAALFVALTLIVFVLLTIKYAEVAIRYPEGGGVVTVAAQAINPLAGLIGGLFILVDYFLTAALSALSGLIYLSVLAPSLAGPVVLLTVVALILLAALNLVGINADAKVTAVIGRRRPAQPARGGDCGARARRRRRCGGGCAEDAFGSAAQRYCAPHRVCWRLSWPSRGSRASRSLPRRWRAHSAEWLRERW